jgi:hypothetical protein
MTIGTFVILVVINDTDLRRSVDVNEGKRGNYHQRALHCFFPINHPPKPTNLGGPLSYSLFSTKNGG